MRPPLFDNPGTVGFFDPKQNVLFCADCGMGMVENPPASTDAFYADGYYGRKSEEDVGYQDYAFTAEHGLLWAQLLVEALKPAGGRVLDVGCADGFLLHRLSGPYERFGIEVNAGGSPSGDGMSAFELDLEGMELMPGV